MKKFRILFAAVALLLVTAGVFAKSARFANAGLYAKSTGGTFYQLTDAEIFDQDLTLTAGGSQAKIIGSSSTTQYTLWYDDGTGTKVAVYTVNIP